MIPKYPYAPDTIKYCAWWLDNDGTWTCPKVERQFELSMTDFQRWNPSLSLPCDALPKEQSFCIAGVDARQAIETVTVEVPTNMTNTVTVEVPSNATNTVTVAVPANTTSTIIVEVPISITNTVTVIENSSQTVTASQTVTVEVTLSATSPAAVTETATIPVTVPVTIPIPVTTVSVTTTTVTTTVFSLPGSETGENGITTPVPHQPQMVDNCKAFYLVQEGDTCVKIAAQFQIAEAQIVAWNPEARSDCTQLLANTYCCVGVL
ncbi:hypothetical protein OQA88_7175 [Cercophora sp. LCS_1]